jgi:TolB-like protein/tetratricopeptide (TPR) repeat protein
MSSDRYIFAQWTLDCGRGALTGADGEIALRPKTFEVLRFLIENGGRLVSRDEILDAVWRNVTVTEESLTHCVSEIRQALGDIDQHIIKTVPRRGYLFTVSVTKHARDDRQAGIGTVREEPQSTRTEGGASGAEPWQAALALPDKPSIAVLPFTNMSGDPEQEYFADGMAEEIVTALSRCSWLFVIARNSSFTYKGRNVDVRQVGRELGVRYVLEGSVRRGGDRLRLTGQLVDATTGAHLWADRFDGELTDVFGLQDRITESVVGAIEPKLQLAEIERLRQKPASDLTAYDLLLRAQQLHYQFTADGCDGAIRCLHQALAIDPEYPQAMALAAYCYAERRLQGWTPDPETEAAVGRRLAMRALDLAGNDGGVLWMVAHAIRILGGDPLRARQLLRLSLSLNPNSFMALTAAAQNEAMLGNAAEALELVARAERISPRDPRAWFMVSARAIAYFFSGQLAETVTWSRISLAQNPRLTRMLRTLAASLAHLGRTEEAAEVVRENLAIEPDLTIASLRQRVHHWPDHAWRRLSEGLRLAGLPE